MYFYILHWEFYILRFQKPSVKTEEPQNLKCKTAKIQAIKKPKGLIFGFRVEYRARTGDLLNHNQAL